MKRLIAAVLIALGITLATAAPSLAYKDTNWPCSAC